jgi:dephospho-CoA kinase
MLIHSALPKELKLIELSDLMIFVDSTDKTIKERLKDKFSEDDVANRLKAQNTRKWYQEIADVVIDNNGTIEDLKKEIEKKCKNLF